MGRNSFLDNIDLPDSQREAVERRRSRDRFTGGGSSSDPIREATEQERRQDMLEQLQSDLSSNEGANVRLNQEERQAILEGKKSVDQIRSQIRERQRKENLRNLQRDLSSSGIKLSKQQREQILSGEAVSEIRGQALKEAREKRLRKEAKEQAARDLRLRQVAAGFVNSQEAVAQKQQKQQNVQAAREISLSDQERRKVQASDALKAKVREARSEVEPIELLGEQVQAGADFVVDRLPGGTSGQRKILRFPGQVIEGIGRVIDSSLTGVAADEKGIKRSRAILIQNPVLAQGGTFRNPISTGAPKDLPAADAANILAEREQKQATAGTALLLSAGPTFSSAGAAPGASALRLRAASTTKSMSVPKTVNRVKVDGKNTNFAFRTSSVNQQGASGALPKGLDLSDVLPRSKVTNPQRLAQGYDENFVFASSVKKGASGQRLPNEVQLRFGNPKQTGSANARLTESGKIIVDRLYGKSSQPKQSTPDQFSVIREAAARQNNQRLGIVADKNLFGGSRLKLRKTESGRVIVDEVGLADLKGTPQASPQQGASGFKSYQRSLEEFERPPADPITDPKFLLPKGRSAAARAQRNLQKVAEESNPIKRLFLDRRASVSPTTSIQKVTPSTKRGPQPEVLPSKGMLKKSRAKPERLNRITTSIRTPPPPSQPSPSETQPLRPEIRPVSRSDSRVNLDSFIDRDVASIQDQYQDVIPGSLQRQQPNQRPRSPQRPRIKIVTDLDQPQKPAEVPKPPRNKMRQRLVPPTASTPINPVPNRPRIPPNRIRPFNKPEFDFGQETQGFDVFVKRRGRFLKQNTQPLTRAQALSKGSFSVGTSAAATFQLREAGRIRSRGSNVEADLRNFTEKRPDLFIEKRGKRISTPGELQEITFKGIRSSKNKKSKRSDFGGLSFGGANIKL